MRAVESVPPADRQTGGWDARTRCDGVSRKHAISCCRRSATGTDPPNRASWQQNCRYHRSPGHRAVALMSDSARQSSAFREAIDGQREEHCKHVASAVRSPTDRERHASDGVPVSRIAGATPAVELEKAKLIDPRRRTEDRDQESASDCGRYAQIYSFQI